MRKMKEITDRVGRLQGMRSSLLNSVQYASNSISPCPLTPDMLNDQVSRINSEIAVLCWVLGIGKEGSASA